MLKCRPLWLRSSRLTKRFVINEETLNQLNVKPLKNTLQTVSVQKPTSKVETKKKSVKSSQYHFISQKKQKFKPDGDKQRRLKLLKSDYAKLVLGKDAFQHRPSYGSIDKSAQFVSIMDQTITMRAVPHKKTFNKGNQASKTLSKYWPELIERESKAHRGWTFNFNLTQA